MFCVNEQVQGCNRSCLALVWWSGSRFWTPDSVLRTPVRQGRVYYVLNYCVSMSGLPISFAPYTYVYPSPAPSSVRLAVNLRIRTDKRTDKRTDSGTDSRRRLLTVVGSVCLVAKSTWVVRFNYEWRATNWVLSSAFLKASRVKSWGENAYCECLPLNVVINLFAYLLNELSCGVLAIYVPVFHVSCSLTILPSKETL